MLMLQGINLPFQTPVAPMQNPMSTVFCPCPCVPLLSPGFTHTRALPITQPR